MNERIQQLAEQAGLQLGIVIENSTTPVKTITIEQRKFAELIVKETMQVVANQLPSNQYLDVADAVLKHFGVEE